MNEPCQEQLKLLSDLQRARAHDERREALQANEALRDHMLFCQKCNPTGLANQLFREAVRVSYG